ncbi:hypothetical protein JTN17_22365, partial [Klebsiella quasipneumoniae]|uniref:hypothetical protein n=1 Tax=Klebsiella quasipneumoniae TaxID=1463165 RepID=UPI0019686726
AAPGTGVSGLPGPHGALVSPPGRLPPDVLRRPPGVIDPWSPRQVPLCPAAFTEVTRLFCSKFMKFVNGGEEISLNVNFSV